MNTVPYAGDYIPNSLPVNPGLELAFFRIPDRTGMNNNLTLINYAVLGNDGQRIKPNNIERAVIMVNGKNRNAGDYAAAVYIGLDQLPDAVKTDINRDTVAVIAPLFANDLDAGKAYPYDSVNGSTSNALVWSGTNWASGDNNIYPKSSTFTSSFDVLDTLVKYFDDASVFPNLKQIVIGGHSMGAATVHRYAAMSTLQTRLPKTYWVANPNDYLWLNNTRPFPMSSCPTFDVWRYGLSQYFPNMTYNAATFSNMTYMGSFLAQGEEFIKVNLMGKQLAFLRSLQDHGDQSEGCAPFTQGKDRFQRFQTYIQYFPLTCDVPSSINCDTIDYVDAPHDAQPAINSPGGLARLFTDNFYGNHSRSYDQYYPRLQPGDDPYPDPSKV